MAGERGTRLVAAITALMMVVEIFAGWWLNSTASLARFTRRFQKSIELATE